MLPWFRVLSLIFSLLLVSGAASSKSPATPAGVSSAPAVIVIGFVGGFVRHDDRDHTEVQLIERLREDLRDGHNTLILDATAERPRPMRTLGSLADA